VMNLSLALDFGQYLSSTRTIDGDAFTLVTVLMDELVVFTLHR